MRRSAWGWNPDGRRRWAVLTLLLGHLLWVILGRGPSGRLQTLLNTLAAPSRAASERWEGWRAGRREKVGSFKAAEAEVWQLRGQVAALRMAQESSAPKLAEAEDAIRLLGLKRLLPLEFRTARVIVNVRNAPFGGMVLDQGQDVGLVADQGVICPEGVVGRLWQVGLSQSSLLPLDAYNASTGVMLARSRATGVLQGLGPGKAAIRYIGSQEVVQVGEPVFTSGLDRLFPRGLLVGYVSAVKLRGVELNVEVSLAAPLDRLRLVLVLPAHPQMELQPPGAPQPAKATSKGGK